MDSPQLSISSEGAMINREQAFLLEDYAQVSTSPSNKTTSNQEEQHSSLSDFHSPPPYTSSSSNTNTNQTPPSISLPPFFTPRYRILRHHITGIRILTLILNVIAIIIPAHANFDSLTIVQVVTLQLTLFPVVLSIVESFSTSAAISKILNPNPKPNAQGRRGKETKRTSVRVEDPETGEERWMLEALPEEETVEVILDKLLGLRKWVLGSDIYMCLMMVGCIVFSCVFGRKNTGNLVGVVIIRVFMLVMIGGTGWMRWALTKSVKRDDDEEEEELLNRYGRE